jgi:hypothetical protein
MGQGATMADYFLVLEAAEFESRVRPALADAWRLRRFDAARPLCAAMLPAARDYAERYHTGAAESLLARVAAGPVPFDRALWRALVGEVLLFAAVEIPEFQVNAVTLRCLLAPQNNGRDREHFTPIEQALDGSRDLTFGAAVYRPEHAGYNAADDVARLAAYLATVRTELWTAASLAGLPDLPAEDRDDELAFAREWFPALAELYRRAADQTRVIVHESIF